MALEFSSDGKYFASISVDGKLKIWNVVSNTFEQEFTPDFHLMSPSTCLLFFNCNSTSHKDISPKKKKRRESESNPQPFILLGTTSGILLLYSITKASLECTLDSETNQSINCLSSTNDNLVYSGVEQHILVWNLQERKIVQKWEGGKEKITAILSIPNSNELLTASKNIKLWDIKTKNLLRTFTGHSLNITSLQLIKPRSEGDTYFISGAKGDRILSCWNLSDNTKSKHAVANFLVEDNFQSISTHVSNDGATNIAVTARSGFLHIYQHTLNGTCSNPFKPKKTVQVVSDTGQNKGVIKPIQIVGSIFRDAETLCIGYGIEAVLTFENISLCSYKKIQCLIRSDPHTIKESKKDQKSKTQTPVVNNEVNYLTSDISSFRSSTITKRKHENQLEVPMETRLENLTLHKSGLSGSKVPKVDNTAHLLVQGLHSDDKKILRTVLNKRDETIIKNTAKRIPIMVLIPLIQELTDYIRGKTLSSQIGSQWMKHILQIHAGILISNPELPELLGSVLGNIENRLAQLKLLNRLKGRLDLLISQVSNTSVTDYNESEAPLLIYNDKDSTDSDSENLQLDINSETESEWDEDNSGEEQLEENNASHSDLESSS